MNVFIFIFNKTNKQNIETQKCDSGKGRILILTDHLLATQKKTKKNHVDITQDPVVIPQLSHLFVRYFINQLFHQIKFSIFFPHSVIMLTLKLMK